MSSLLNTLKRSLIAQIGLFYLFVASGLVTNLLQLLTLVIWPVNKKLYRKLNIYLAYGFWASEFLLSLSLFSSIHVIKLIAFIHRFYVARTVLVEQYVQVVH